MNSTEIQEKLNAYNRQKAGLKNKPWFRTLEVLYWLALGISSLIVLILTFSSYDQGFTIFFWGGIIVYVVFIIIKKVGYYIVIGSLKTIEPEFKDTLDSRFKK